MTFRLWQEVGAAIEMQVQSLVSADEAASGATFQVFCTGAPMVSEIVFNGPGRVPLISVPLTLSGCESTSLESRGYLVKRGVEERYDVVAVQSLTAALSGDCKGYDMESIGVSIRSRRYMWDEAFWTPGMFGSDYPWGVHLTNEVGKVGDADVPDMLKQDIAFDKVALLIDEVPLVTLSGLVAQGEARSDSWKASWNSVASDLNASTEIPGSAAVGKIERVVLQAFVAEMLDASREELASGAPEAEGLQALVQAIASVSPARQCVVEEVTSNPPTEEEKAAVLACQTDNRTVAAAELKNEIPETQQAQWNFFTDKMVDAQCTLLHPNIPYNSLEACMAACEREHEVSGSTCNAVAWAATDKLCNSYMCDTFDRLLSNEGSTVAIYASPEQLGLFESAATDAQIVAGTPMGEILTILMNLPLSDLASPLDFYASVADAVTLWNERVRIWEKGVLNFEMLEREFVNMFFQELIHADFSWMSGEELKSTLYENQLASGSSNVIVTAELRSLFRRQTPQSNFNIEQHMSSGGARWKETYVLDGLTTCRVEVQMEWVYRRSASTEYTKQPTMVPAMESLFAAYGQFSSLLPGYASQVLERLEPQQNGIFSGLALGGLPYASTDGRYLHRNLRKEEEDLLIYKGQLGLNDAAFNFPKAFAKSKHRREPSFWFNSGLSVANLFVRAVGDVQALLNLHFAGHTDWDGQCQTLPARFNLMYEYHDSYVRNRATSWGLGRVASRERFLKTWNPRPQIPSHYAGATVSDRGRELTDDERELFIGWHWISSPTSRRNREERARFFKTTGSSTKGKDSWVVENVSDASAVMWPLIWCQLASNEWVEEEQGILFAKNEAQDQATIEEIDEFLAGNPNETEHGIVPKVSLIRNEYSEVGEYSCPVNPNETLLDGLVEKWDVMADASLHAWTFSSDSLLHDLRLYIDQAIIDSPESKKELDNVLSAISGVADTIREIVHAQELEALTFRETLQSLLPFFDLDTSQTREDRRALFFMNLDELRVLRIQRDQKTLDTQGELERLVFDHPQATTDDQKRALSYMAPLFTGALHMQLMLERRLQTLATCWRIAQRPAHLDRQRFEPWVPQSHPLRHDSIAELLSMVDVSSSSDSIIGVDLMFDSACRTGADGTPNALVESRPECEQVLLGKAMLTLFPTLSLRIVKDFTNLQSSLNALVLDPTQSKVEEMLEMVRKFMRDLRQGTDEDFYTAFAYHRDGRMVGDLFRTTRDTFTDILESLDSQEKTYTEWIRTSVEYADELKNMRRAHVKELADTPEIAASVDGCACEERWSAWVISGGLPYRRSFDGCAVLEGNSGIWGYSEDVATWTGVCRAKKRLTAISKCDLIGKLVACDSSLAPSTSNFRIWSTGSRSSPVALPLVSTTFFLGLTVRPHTIPNFCGPDMARLAVLRTYQWASSSWLPWTQSRQSCWEAYIAPPGVKIDILQCRKGKGDDFQDESGTSDWTVTLTFPFLIRSNTWGVGGRPSGDSFQTWFTGTWLNPMKMVFGNGIEGWLGARPSWEHGTVWNGFNLDAKEMALSGSAYWIALAAEVISAFNIPLATGAVLNGFEGKKGLEQNKQGFIFSAAWTVWSLLAKFEVIPGNWDIWIGRPAMAKWLNSITPSNVFFSPFRSSNAYILVVRYNIINQISIRPWPAFFPDMSSEQMFILGERTSEMGAPTGKYLTEFRNSVGNTLDDLENLDRAVHQHVFSTWVDVHDPNRTVAPRLFNRCPGVVKRYNIDFSRYEGEDISNLQLYWFRSKSLSAWIPSGLDPSSGPWYLVEHTDGWLAEARPANEEPRFFPPQYKDILIVTGTLGVDFQPSAALREAVFASLDFDAVICITEQLLPRGGRSILDAYIDQGCNSGDQTQRSLWGPFFSCFGNGWKSRFFTAYWSRIVASVQGLGSLALDALLFEFKRGDFNGIELDTAGGGEKSEFRLAPSLAGSLILGCKLGLTQMRIPGLAQVMPWLSWSVVYSVNQLIEAFRVRLSGLLGAPKKTTSSSISEHHEDRIAACKACVEDPEMAYCDNEFVLNSMFSDPDDIASLQEYNADRCVPRTEEQRNMCKRGVGASRNRQAGVLFQDAMCPCFDKVSGQAVTPDWYTSVGSCEDLRLADSGEDLRQANKASDFLNGFADLGERFDLGTITLHDPALNGCSSAYTCCGAQIQGAQHLRCVNKDDLKSTGWFRDSKCKHFNPKDPLAQNAERKRRWYLIARRPAWSEQDNWQCKGDRSLTGSTFEGYWSLDGANGWVLDPESE